ncbi:MAG: DUF1361 domain-containing protein [Candidatus Saccharibacteria bacterium]
MRWYFSNTTRLGLALACSSLASIGLFAAGAISNHSSEFAYLLWNLFLAWIPLGLALWLHKVLRRKVWSSWEALLVTALWIGFLPNSFYMISDFIHIQDVPRVDLLYDVVMFSSFIFNGVILGFLALYNVHLELLQRMKRRTGHIVLALVLLICCFAIYLGRDLRWNTWDVLVNPAGILIDVSDRILHPVAYSQAYSTTITFFVLLGSLYMVAWQTARAMRYQKVMDDTAEQ